MKWQVINKARGFTLVELLIAIAIVALLATVAWPAYQDSVERTRRADGISAALALQLAQERFRGNCPYYAQNIGSSNVCGANAGASTLAGNTTSPDGYYSLAIQAGSASGNSFTIVATPQGAQAGDSACSPMTITFNPANPGGVRAPADCW